jgi:hypothetical protein
MAAFTAPSRTYSENYYKRINHIQLERTLLSSQVVEFKCPFCDRMSASPGGVRFHVKLTHPERLDEFNKKHYPEMENEFKTHFKE